MALIEFKNLPDTSTPLDAENLNNNFEFLDEKIKNLNNDFDELKNTIDKKKVKHVEINLKSGETHVDEDILQSENIIVYYSINESGYLKSAIIPKNNNNWFWDSYNNLLIYFRADWEKGEIKTSNGTTVNDFVKIVGYDLIMK